MEKNKATTYIPTQKKKEFQPPMAERVDFGFMDISLVFQRFPDWVFLFLRKSQGSGDYKD
jgi:hypothetical protein